MEYEQPNINNVKKGDHVLEVEKRKLLFIPIIEAAELSAITFYNNHREEPVAGTYPYITSVIQKEDGTILRGGDVSDSDLEKVLGLLPEVKV